MRLELYHLLTFYRYFIVLEDHSDNAKPYAGILQCYTSLVQLNMVTPYLKYDPIEEMTCRKAYLQQQVPNFKSNDLQMSYCEKLELKMPIQRQNKRVPLYNVYLPPTIKTLTPFLLELLF